jgi:hypothetical protein
MKRTNLYTILGKPQKQQVSHAGEARAQRRQDLTHTRADCPLSLALEDKVPLVFVAASETLAIG